MRKVLTVLCSLLVLTAAAKKKQTVELWPDGTVMDAWFQNVQKVDPATLGRQYVLTDYGVTAGCGEVQTADRTVHASMVLTLPSAALYIEEEA